MPIWKDHSRKYVNQYFSTFLLIKPHLFNSFYIIYLKREKNNFSIRILMFRIMNRGVWNQMLCVNINLKKITRILSYLANSTLAYSTAFNKFLNNDSFITIFVIIFWNINIWIVFHQFPGFFCIINFNSKINFLNAKTLLS